MKEEKIIYLASLFHDIGKFIERAKIKKFQDKVKERYNNSGIRYGHPKYSAIFVDMVKGDNEILNRIRNLVLYHHSPPKSILDYIVSLADFISSTEREEIEEKGKDYTRIPLNSIFSHAFGENDTYVYPLKELNINYIYPQKNIQVSNKDYKSLVNKFIDEIEGLSIDKRSDILWIESIFEKYLWAVPSTTQDTPDISLFDHLRTTAGIALCLYKNFKMGLLSEEDFKNMHSNFKDKNKDILNKKMFKFMKIDISGIQDFITSDISLEIEEGKHIKALKDLKGRSVFLQLLIEVLVRRILKEFNLYYSNVIYKSGGNAYLLLPLIEEENINKLREKISDILFRSLKGEIYVSIDAVEISINDLSFGSINEVNIWRMVSEKVNERKKKKWREIGLENLWQDTIQQKEMENLYKSFIKLGTEVKNNKYIIIEEYYNKSKNDISWNSIFMEIGYKITVTPDVSSEGEVLYIIDDEEWDLSESEGVILGGLKVYNDKLSGDKNKGEEKNLLAMFKMDMDDLGWIFKHAFREKTTFSRISNLSRMIKYFFEWEIPLLARAYNLYCVYAGGDDTLVVGKWYDIIDFAIKLHEKFRKYVANNQYFKFSGAISFFKEKFPVRKVFVIVDDLLTETKQNTFDIEKIKSKNAVGIMNGYLKWDDFKEAYEIYKFLRENISDADNNDENKVPRQILFRLMDAVEFLQKSDRYYLSKMWGLKYYVKRKKRKEKNNDDKQYNKKLKDISNYYYKNLSDFIMGKKNPHLLWVGAKLAELSTKKEV